MGTLQNWRMFSLARAAPLDAVSPDVSRIVLWLFPWRSRRKWVFQECFDSIHGNTKGWVMELHCGQADGVMINKLCCHQGPELGMLLGISFLSPAPSPSDWSSIFHFIHFLACPIIRFSSSLFHQSQSLFALFPYRLPDIQRSNSETPPPFLFYFKESDSA